MTDFDRANLDRLLPAPPGVADWDDVLNRSRRQHRRHRVLVALASAALVVVGTASAFAVRAIVDGGGVTALPPEGSTPSTPKTGKLVLSYDGRPELSGFPGRFVPVNQVWVYADGRMIWRREGGPAGVGGIRTGFLEQRLTAKGVDRVRSEIVSTGLFDRDHVFESAHDLAWGTIQVRNGKRLVSAQWPSSRHRTRGTVPTKEQARALARLTELVSPPASWLPASAWEDRRLRSYVPSRYAICFSRNGRFLEPSRVLQFLPAAARRLLPGKARTYGAFSLFSSDRASLSVTCSQVTITEAHALNGIFSGAGLEREPRRGGDGVWVNDRFRGRPPIHSVFISFEPILPHGEWEAMGG